MGQKTNPNIFRLGVNKKWKTEFFEKKSQELPNYTFKDLEIRTYIERFLETKNLLLHDYKVHYSNSILNIYISYFITPSFAFEKFPSDSNITIAKKSGSQRIVIQICNKANLQKKNFQKVLLPKRSLLGVKKKKSLFSTIDFPSKIKKYLELKYYRPNPLLDRTPRLDPEEILGKTVGNFTEKLYDQSPISLNVNCSKPMISENLESSRIRNDFQKLLKALSLFTNEQYNIVTTLQCVNKTFSPTFKQTQSLKEKFLLLQKFKNAPFFEGSIDILFSSVYNRKSAHLLSKLIAFQFKTVKRHKFFLAFLKKTLTAFINSNFSKVKGIKIIVKGRLNGAPRAKHKILTLGSVPVQTIMSDMDYAQSTCHNSNGSYGVRVWILGKF